MLQVAEANAPWPVFALSTLPSSEIRSADRSAALTERANERFAKRLNQPRPRRWMFLTVCWGMTALMG